MDFSDIIRSTGFSTGEYSVKSSWYLHSVSNFLMCSSQRLTTWSFLKDGNPIVWMEKGPWYPSSSPSSLVLAQQSTFCCPCGLFSSSLLWSPYACYLPLVTSSFVFCLLCLYAVRYSSDFSYSCLFLKAALFYFIAASTESFYRQASL